MQDKLHFRISSALKDIIGRDLITDDFVAVFELVKNSFDAYADQVDIYFENIYSSNSKIIIKDNGKGMNFLDLQNKWLFVAYSAKKEGTEDETFDYRNKIYQQRIFAGAKGIGRFSCDRLGKTLYLETTKFEENPKTEVLITEWEKFENNLKDEFIDISVLHETKIKSDYELNHGTVLEISDLRGEWDRSKLFKLKESLAKLINPNQQQEKKFSIIFHVPDEIESDKNFEKEYVLNGEVENFIFDTLGLKTTKIYTTISFDGKYCTTELIDGGTIIYKIKENNKFQLLNNINMSLYYLNRSAKITFSRKMGLAVMRFGNIFLYKNGFRIYPFGEPGEDPLKVNVRKAQGYNRYLGLRELIGQIEINNENPELRETSSRGDGLIKTKTYYQLEDFFWETLKRLEKYVIDVQQWGLSIESDLSFEDDLNVKRNTLDLIAKITNPADVIDIEYGENFLEIIQNQNESAISVIKNLRLIASETGNDKLLEVAKIAEIKIAAFQKALQESENEISVEKYNVKKYKEELDETISQNLFLKSIKSQDLDEVVSFLHHISISASTIDNYLKGLYYRLQNDINISKDELKEVIQIVSFENRKVIAISKFASKANFKLFTSEDIIDVVEYIKEYIFNVLGPLKEQKPVISISENSVFSFKTYIKPIELNIIVDNLISNSRKANSNKLVISFSEPSNDSLMISFKDDGIGTSEKKIEKLFEFGYTTTDGSGLGLFHLKKIVDNFDGEIIINKDLTKGFEISIIIKKKIYERL